ncbi:hypothetical protein AX774_g108 [Zancudomyces culisetae]|uniref:Uncharacterized protein n=1 Tax=Zancudomyces culisetae TaxID=1213189 RepID=A0A1R1PZ15_ZANCU|nr:hypothetical protein AX774_g108 [Zancudomyces culisetae]|eukprot:OMH86218.1 hypothetical protein AX774_g108 [Zancudomyces culisetae]
MQIKGKKSKGSFDLITNENLIDYHRFLLSRGVASLYMQYNDAEDWKENYSKQIEEIKRRATLKERGDESDDDQGEEREELWVYFIAEQIKGMVEKSAADREVEVVSTGELDWAALLIPVSDGNGQDFK